MTIESHSIPKDPATQSELTEAWKTMESILLRNDGGNSNRILEVAECRAKIMSLCAQETAVDPQIRKIQESAQGDSQSLKAKLQPAS